MSVSSKLIQKYYQARAGSKFAGIVTQIDAAVQTMARMIDADFVAVFYYERTTKKLIPISYQYGYHLSIRNLGALETLWANVDTDSLPVDPDMFDLTKKKPRERSIRDQFGIDNSFASCYRYPYYLDGELRLICTAYWYECPNSISLEAVHFLNQNCKIISAAMVIADELALVENYSTRLSQLLPVFEVSLGNLQYDELLDEIAKRINILIPEAEILLLQRDSSAEGDTSGIFSLKNHLNCDSPSAEEINLLTERVKPLLWPDLPEDTVKYRCRDLNQTEGSSWSDAVMLELAPDEDIQFVAVITPPENSKLSANDRELLSVFAVFAQTVLRNVLLVERLKNTNLLLEESSQRLTEVETTAALTDMTSGLAHSFNNIFGGIVGRVQLMKLRTQDNAQIVELEKIESMVMEGAESVRRIQEFTTCVKHKEIQPINLCKLLDVLTEKGRATWQKAAVDKDIEVVVKCLLDDAEIAGNHDDILIVIDKLIHNAVEFSPEGSVINVEVDGAQEHITLTVSDEGPGIPKELRAKVFYPFYTTKQERSAGLGLAIVYGVVGRHGGKVRVESRDKGGAVFVVTFNRAEGQMPKIAQKVSSGENQKHLRILIVDDDMEICEVLKDTLSIDGYSPVVCADGYAALEKIEKQKFDMMITDLGMPGMSGLDLAGTVHEQFPNMPIAMVTGWGTQLNEDEIALKGIKSVLSKPFHLNDIKLLVENLTAII